MKGAMLPHLGSCCLTRTRDRADHWRCQIPAQRHQSREGRL